MNVCWLILCVIFEYLESQENTCSHTSVSTCEFRVQIPRSVEYINLNEMSVIPYEVLETWKDHNVPCTMGQCDPSYAFCPQPFGLRQVALFVLLNWIILD